MIVGICTMCPCDELETGPYEGGCPKHLHPAHMMQPVGSSGFWFCPVHDRSLDYKRTLTA